jgi:CRISPR-associated protein Cst1
MERQFATIDYNWLITPTGDPFADIGGYVIKELEKRFPDKDILELIEYITKIYVDKWKTSMYSFFLNSPVIQPAFKGREFKETMQYFWSLINETNCRGMGVCRITGQRTKLFVAGRHNSILSGSGKFVNFHHSFEDGIMVSKEALIRFYFAPLGCISLNGKKGKRNVSKIILIHSYDEYFSEYFARTNFEPNLAAIGKNTSTGILQSKCKSPGTALFRFIDMAMTNYNRKGGDKKNGSLTLYHFTNFKDIPEVTIYSISNQLFRFYSFTQGPKTKADWNSFVARYYRNSEFKDAKYNEKTNHVDFEEKEIITTIPESDYKNWTNIIYNKLLNGQSILNEMLNRSKKNKFNFLIVKIYQIKIRNMKKETISKIEEMTEFIFSANNEAGIEKAIKELNKAYDSYSFRRFIIKNIVTKYYEKYHNEDDTAPILKVKEYTDHLFPDTNLWKEIRDVLLISIYQKLHEKNIKLNLNTDNEEENEIYNTIE